MAAKQTGTGKTKAKSKAKPKPKTKGNATSKAKPKTVKRTKVIGRPSSYKRETVDALFALIADGLTVRAACKKPGMPVASTFYRWLQEHPELNADYAKAIEMHADAVFDEILEIADNTGNEANDTFINDEGYEKPNHEWINRSRLRVDARKWYLARRAPKKYGDKLELSGNPDSPIRLSHELEELDDRSLDELIQGFTKGVEGK